MRLWVQYVYLCLNKKKERTEWKEKGEMIKRKRGKNEREMKREDKMKKRRKIEKKSMR